MLLHTVPLQILRNQPLLMEPMHNLVRSLLFPPISRSSGQVWTTKQLFCSCSQYLLAPLPHTWIFGIIVIRLLKAQHLSPTSLLALLTPFFPFAEIREEYKVSSGWLLVLCFLSYAQEVNKGIYWGREMRLQDLTLRKQWLSLLLIWDTCFEFNLGNVESLLRENHWP